MSLEKQGSAPVGKLLWQYSLPAVAGFLVNAVYQLVDRVLVGRGVGTEAMAAVTCAFPLTILGMGLGLLLGTGTGNLISTYLGQGRREEAEKVLGQAVRLSLLLGGSFALVCEVAARPILRACGAEGVVLELAIPFLRITAIGQVCLVAIISMGNILRVQGRPGLGLAFMSGGTVLNAVLAAWAIFGLRWGIAGAALATTVAVAANLVALVVFVQSPRSLLHIRRAHLRGDGALARAIVGLGAPVLLMQVLGMLGFLVANRAALALGGARAVAMVGAINTVNMVLIYPSIGVSQAMQPLVAFNRGAGRPDRVLGLLLRVLVTTTVMGCVAAAAVMLFSDRVAAAFTRTDLELVELIRRGLPWFVGPVALFGVQATASYYFLAVQRPVQAAVLLLGRQILFIPVFLVLPPLLGYRGLFLAALLPDVPFALLAVVLLREEWRKLRGASATVEAGGVAAEA